MPTSAHMALLKRILRYLKGTRTLGIRFVRGPGEMEGFCDADYANDIPSSRSTTGYLINLSGPIVWRSVRQPLVALSSTEAEYIADCDLVKEMLPCRYILKELRQLGDSPVVIYIDNLSAVKISSNLIRATHFTDRKEVTIFKVAFFSRTV